MQDEFFPPDDAVLRDRAVRLYGADRIVCGTDGTEFGVGWTRDALAGADIGVEAREQLLHGNAGGLIARRLARRRRREHRPTLIICDDLQNDGHILSPTQRERSRTWFHGTLLKAGTRAR